MAAIFTCSISIHAPPRGATLKAVLKDATGQISIHAPPRGATAWRVWMNYYPTFQFTPLRERRRIYTRRKRKIVAFQFTPLREGRQPEPAAASRSASISIHAPPRGATQQVGNAGLLIGFQFTPLREGRRASRDTARFQIKFQFTPLREGRQRARKARRHETARFQFTPLREGRLTLHDNRAEAGKISIHAPPRGATRRTSPPSRNA